MMEKIDTTLRRQGKTYGIKLSIIYLVKHALATNRSLAIGTSKVDELYEELIKEFPLANISKKKNLIVINKGK